MPQKQEYIDPNHYKDGVRVVFRNQADEKAHADALEQAKQDAAAKVKADEEAAKKAAEPQPETNAEIEAKSEYPKFAPGFGPDEDKADKPVVDTVEVPSQTTKAFEENAKQLATSPLNKQQPKADQVKPAGE